MAVPNGPVRTSQQLSELVDGQTCIFDDPGHCECIDRILTRKVNASDPIAHCYVASLPDDSESYLLEGCYGSLMIDARNPRHPLHFCR